MQITLSFDNFTELPYTSGTIQNISSQATVEICQDDTVNSGLILGPGEWFSWSNSTIYARSAWDWEPTAKCAVVPFLKQGEGGGSEYILPVATKTTLGGVKSSDEDGKIKVNSDGTMTVNGGSSYTLPTASASTLGGIKVGDRLSIDANGVLSAADQSYSLPTASASALGGVKSSTADGKISVDSTTGVMTYNEPTPTVEPIVAPEWVSGNSYPQNALVSNNSNVYIALVAHTAGADFATDLAAGKWQLVGASSSSVNNGGYIQSTQLGIVGSSSTPADIFLPINTTKSFCLPPIDVLEITPGAQNQVLVTNTMSSGDAASFNYDSNFVKFSGAIELITSYNLTMSSPSTLGDGFVSESNLIDPSDYVEIEGVQL